jgi:hypothetical protein
MVRGRQRALRVVSSCLLFVCWAGGARSLAAAADDSSWWSVQGGGNTAGVFTVEHRILFRSAKEGSCYPRVLHSSSQATYVGYVIERADDRSLVMAQILDQSGASTGRHIWFTFPFARDVVLLPHVRYRMVLVSDAPLVLNVWVAHGSIAPVTTSRPVKVDLVHQDVDLMPYINEARVAVPGRGGSVALASVYQVAAVDATFRPVLCLVSAGQPCPPGIPGYFIGPGALTGSGAYAYYSNAEAAKTAGSGPLPSAPREIVAKIDGVRVPLRTTIFGFVVH